MKTLKPLNPSLYPVDPWQIAEESYRLEDQPLGETIFALSNGYLGIRGSFEEGLANKNGKSICGIYINGFYESVPIPQAEKGYGYALNTQTMLNVTDSRIIEIWLDQERVTVDTGELLSFKRFLNLRQGCLIRQVAWRSPEGRELEYSFKRVVSFQRRNLMSFELTLKPLNFSGLITIASVLEGAVDNHVHAEEDPRFSTSLGRLGLNVSSIRFSGSSAVMVQETRRSGLSLACAMDNCFKSAKPCTVEDRLVGNRAALIHEFFADEGHSHSFEKHVAYYTSRDHPAGALAELALKLTSGAKENGFALILEEQCRHCRRFWEGIDLKLSGDPPAEQGLRFNLFHLLQAANSRGVTGIGAKGLTSEGYDGHYFWDTEIYMLPFYCATMPEQARELLKFRHSILGFARARARELSHPKGALFPWRTIAGEEGSSYYPASTAQYHINAAIGYAISKYLDYTGDIDFILDYGAEMIFETARLWEDLGAYIPSKGNRFCYNEVTGPDEYTALVNNNCYTNLMARWHLQYACKTAEFIRADYPESYASIREKIGLEDSEIQAWRSAAENMFIPYDEAKKIHPQDDGFLDKEIWDFDSTPPENYPLLLHYHPLVIYRYQVCKQPDVVLAQLLLDDQFDLEQKRRNYSYYEAITTHDSSLSPSVFSVAAAELGFADDAYRYFCLAARLDLDNIFTDTHYGVHLANMAGSWKALIHGFAGMRTGGGRLSFKPYLPRGWNGYSFAVLFRGNRLKLEVKQDEITYSLVEGLGLTFFHQDRPVSLKPGEIVLFSSPVDEHQGRGL